MKQKRMVKMTSLYIALILATIVTVFPIYWMAQMSLKTHKQAITMPPDLLFKPIFSAYRAAWSKAGFVPALLNSIIVSAMTLVVSVSVGALAAYAFSRYRFWGDQLIFFIILMTRIFPPIALILPFYLNLRLIGGHDTHWGLALAYLTMNIPLAIWMLKGYFDTIPQDLEYCAMIDGANRFQAATRITVPLIAPGIVATGIFIFILSWNEFLFALILTSQQARTLPIVIAEFVGETGVEWPVIMAASVMALIPVITFTFMIQQHLAQGLSAGAIKG